MVGHVLRGKFRYPRLNIVSDGCGVDIISNAAEWGNGEWGKCVKTVQKS